MMDILTKVGVIFFWFATVVVAGTAYFFAMAFVLKKGWISDGVANAIYFLTFVIIASVVYKSSLF